MNRSQLSLYTFANYLPLLSKIILYPLLISKLGSGLWVLIASMDAFFNIYSLLVEYGFAINGIKTLSDRKINYDNKIKFVSKTIFTQIALFIIFLLPFLALSFVFFEKEIIKNYFTYFAIYFFLFTCKPVWILKGFKQFFTLSLAHFISNITLLLGVLFFVQESSDFLIFLILRIVSIAFYYLIAIKKLKEVRFYIKYFNEIIPSIKQSFDYFLSRLSGVFNTNFIILFANHFLSENYSFIFILSLKIIDVFYMGFSFISEYFFVKFNSVSFKNIKKELIRIIILSFGSIIFLFLFLKILEQNPSFEIVKNNIIVVHTLSILCFVLFFKIINLFFAFFHFLPTNRIKIFNVISITCSVIIFCMLYFYSTIDNSYLLFQILCKLLIALHGLISFFLIINFLKNKKIVY